MNRRNRTIAVLLVAVGLASLASYVVYRTIARMPVRQVEVASVYVAVATENLSMGTRISKEHVKVVGWPAASPVKGSFPSAEALIGRGLIQPVSANEPLTESKLAPIEAGAGLPPSITPGMRALSVKVNEVIGVAGFAVPGSRVDVIVVLNNRDDSMARVVVSNVQVLTAGTRYDTEQAKDGKPIPSSVVTLLVTPEDAERISLANTGGKITLVLRNPLDTIATDTKGVRMASLMGAPEPPPVINAVRGQVMRVAAPKPAPEPPKIYSVEAIRGQKRSEEVVNKIGGGQ
jgi:pilus assembly protein CpaB